MTVQNKDVTSGTLRLANKDFGVDSTFTIPGQKTCTIQFRSGKYQYEFNHCGEVFSGSNPLNDKWYATMQCP
jgi:hypothetical protein